MVAAAPRIKSNEPANDKVQRANGELEMAHYLRLPWAGAKEANLGAREITKDESPGNLAVAAATKAPANAPRHKVCLATKIYNHARYIPQWFEYHFLLGVDYFLIVNDCSSDPDTHMVLSYYQSLGLIYYKHSPWNLDQPCFGHPPGYRPSESQNLRYLVERAKPICDWIGAMDVDEYIVSTDEAHFNFSHTLDRLPDPKVIRLAWEVIGSEGLEKRQPGRLVIETFRRGLVARLPSIKTFAHSSLIGVWKFPHHPNSYAASVHGNETLRARFQKESVHPDEIELVNGCTRVVAPVFIKHYQFFSFEEYNATRASKPITAAGKPNVYFYRGRDLWLPGNYSASTPCSGYLAANLMDKMIPLVKRALSIRLPATWPDRLRLLA